MYGFSVFMDMSTYNANSYEAWLRQFAPAVAPDVPRAQLGAGLGCWVEHAADGGGARGGRRQLQPVPARIANAGAAVSAAPPPLLAFMAVSITFVGVSIAMMHRGYQQAKRHRDVLIGVEPDPGERRAAGLRLHEPFRRRDRSENSPPTSHPHGAPARRTCALGASLMAALSCAGLSC